MISRFFCRKLSSSRTIDCPTALRPVIAQIETMEARTLFAADAKIAIFGNVSGTTAKASNELITIKAGQSVHVDASLSDFDDAAAGEEAKRSRYKFVWDFGDTTASSKYNILPGFNAAHVYNVSSATPYTITLQMTQPDGTVIANETLRVQVDANDRDLAANTIYVHSGITSAQDNDGRTGTNPSLPVSWNKMVSLLRGSNFQNDTTVCFFAGDEVWATSTGVDETVDHSKYVPLVLKTANGSSQLQNVQFVQYGSGARPIISLPTIADKTQTNPAVEDNLAGMEDNNKNITFKNLEFRAHYTSSELSSNPTQINSKVVTIKPNGDNVVVDGCRFRNVNAAMTSSSQYLNGLLVMDSDTGLVNEGQSNEYPDGIGEGFVYTSAGSTDIVLLGNKIGDATRNNHNVRTNSSAVMAYKNTLRQLHNDPTPAAGDPQPPIANPTDECSLRANNGNYIFWSQNTVTGGQLYLGDFGNQAYYSSTNPLGYNGMKYIVIERNKVFREPSPAPGFEHIGEARVLFNRQQSTNADGGSINVNYIVFRNNYVEGSLNNAGTAGTRTFESKAEGIDILNNTFAMGPNETVLFKLYSNIKNAKIRNNLVDRQNNTSSIKIIEANTSTGGMDNAASIVSRPGNEIAGNLWPPSSNFDFKVTDYSSTASFQSALIAADPNKTAQYTPASTEADVTLDSVTYAPQGTAAEVGTVVNGVFDDLQGASRPASGTWTAGAVQKPSATVTASNFNVDAARMELTFTLDTNITTISASDLTLYNYTTSSNIPSNAINFVGISQQGSDWVARFRFDANSVYSNGVLPNGRYLGTLADSSLSASFAAPFFFQQGDMNRDGIVDSSDSAILSANYGATGRVFSQGNLDYDATGSVNTLDFNLLAGQTGSSLVTAASATEDTFIRPSTSGVGANSTVEVKYSSGSFRRDGLFKFDLTGVTGKVSKATLRLFAAASEVYSPTETITAQVFETSDTWNESTTWDSANPSNNPQPLGSMLGSIAVTTSSTSIGQYDVDITALIKSKQLAGASVVSVILIAPSINTNKFMAINSSESASNQPQLRLV